MQRAKSRGDHENTEELNQLKFEIQQKDEMLLLKTETAKNLEKQLEQQKKRMEQEAKKMQTDLKAENDNLKNELEKMKDYDTLKEAQIGELRKQCTELVTNKSIEINLLVNKAG